MATEPVRSLGAIEVGGMTRSAFLVRSALAAGALYGGQAVGPVAQRAFAQGGGDVEILNFALMLQYLEADFYLQGLKLQLADDVRMLASDFREQEQDHVAALTKAVTAAGGKPVKKPTFTFPIEDEGSFVTLGMTLEDTGVKAFNGAGPKLKSKEALAGAGMIVQVEARQAAALRLAAMEQPAPEAFDETIEMNDAMEAAEP
ncbi:MAG: ferritin-like domain-containing protein, partial [Solirubrobacteraceae bacterium]